MEDKSSFERASSELAAAILESTRGSDAETSLLILTAGGLPAGIALAASRFAVARARAAKKPQVGVTPVLARYGQAIAELQSWLGRDPSVSELAQHTGRARTPAHKAMLALRKLGAYPCIGSTS